MTDQNAEMAVAEESNTHRAERFLIEIRKQHALWSREQDTGHHINCALSVLQFSSWFIANLTSIVYTFESLCDRVKELEQKDG